MLNVVGLTDLKRVLIYDMVFHPGSINMCDFQVVVSMVSNDFLFSP